MNTTPVGMYPNNGEKAVELADFPMCRAVIDIIYNPSRTALLLDAEDLNIPCVNGLSMLAAQAKRAAEIFTGAAIEDSVINDITRKIERQTKNIVLIGMPGSGKSTTGAELARLTGRAFIDTDEQIAKKAGKSIPEIFAECGETVSAGWKPLREASKRAAALSPPAAASSRGRKTCGSSAKTASASFWTATLPRCRRTVAPFPCKSASSHLQRSACPCTTAGATSRLRQTASKRLPKE